MKNTLFFTLLIALTRSCTPEKREVDFGEFTLTLPAKWEKFKVRGIDSQVGGITNYTDSVYYDYGWYSSGFDFEDASVHNYSQDVVDNRNALIIRPIEPGSGTLGIIIKDALNGNKLNLIGHNIKNEKEVIEIFKSIDFQDNYTDVVSENFGENYQPITNQKRHQQMFNNHCGICHSTLFENEPPHFLDSATVTTFDLWMKKEGPLPDSNTTESIAGPGYHRGMGGALSDSTLQILRTFFPEEL